MLNEPTVAKLHTLRLGAMAAAWMAQREDTKMNEIDFDGRFGMLVDAEHLARDNKRLARALDRAPRSFHPARGAATWPFTSPRVRRLSPSRAAPRPSECTEWPSVSTAKVFASFPTEELAVMSTRSRFSGFRKLSIAERQVLLAETTGVGLAEIRGGLEDGGLHVAVADKFVENVIGTYGLPYAIAPNFVINGREFLVPMVVEEPSVVAAASNAARMTATGGGFRVEIDPPLMISQVQVTSVPDIPKAIRALEEARDSLLATAGAAVPGLLARGGGPRDIEIRTVTGPGGSSVVVHLIVDCRDAMGANLVNTVAEATGPRVARLTGGRLGLCILSNLCDRRRVRVRCSIPADVLATPDLSGGDVADRIEEACRFAEADPYRAATHNKGVMNGIDAVALATGNDWRAVEAGAHAYAARDGRYAPLSIWRRIDTDRGCALRGELELPLALGIVGGTLRVHPAARLALRLLGARDAGELSAVAAAVGLANNLAALRALATDGIQRGHMALHARSVSIAAESNGDLVNRVAAVVLREQDDAARSVLHSLPSSEVREFAPEQLP